MIDRGVWSASLWGYWPVLGLDAPEPDWSGNGRHTSVVGTTPAYANHSPTQLWMPPRTGVIQDAVGGAIYSATKFRLYSDDGTGLGEAA